MNINKHNNSADAEIERDVAELRAMVKNTGENPSEPHPAYWQNFPLRLHERIEHGVPKKQGIRSFIWAPALGAALVIVVTMSTIFWPKGGSDNRADSTARHIAAAAPNGGANASAHLYNDQQESSSLVLSKGEVKMLDAIMSDDDNALFNAVVDNQ